MTKLAVALLHGIGSQCPDFADDMVCQLKARVTARLPPEAHASVLFKPICWADILREREEWLFHRMGQFSQLSWQWLRRLIVEWLGDAIAYEPTATNRIAYDAIHCRIAKQLLEFADEAGHDTPLCIVAHSFGSVIASNYFKDFQLACNSAQPNLRPVCRNLLDVTRQSPLASGETLAAMITLGSPIGLWSLRCLGNEKPLLLPAPQLARRLPTLEGVWLNLIAPNDVLAFPLSALNDDYARVVIDVPIRLKAGLSRWHPLSHFHYWSDATVIQSISATLACVWQNLAAAGMNEVHCTKIDVGRPI
jgi:hypothetical protein